MDANVVTLIAAIMALAGSIVTVVVGSKLAVRSERRKLLWMKELDRFFQLEEMAGRLVEVCVVRDPRWQSLVAELDQAADRFRRYCGVSDAIRALRTSFDEWRESTGSGDVGVPEPMQGAYDELLRACDAVTGRDARRQLFGQRAT